MSVRAPTPDQEAFAAEVKLVMLKYAHLTPPELLALSAYIVGQLLALQDQTKWTAESAMEIVNENIVLGNQRMITAIESGEVQGTA